MPAELADVPDHIDGGRGLQGPMVQPRTARQVDDHGALVAHDGPAHEAEADRHRPRAAEHAAGDDHEGNAGRRERGDAGPGEIGELQRRREQGAVEVAGDELGPVERDRGREGHANDRAYLRRRPSMNRSRSTSPASVAPMR